jgi:cytoskeletal protein CcmA (bactofilin family)
MNSPTPTSEILRARIANANGGANGNGHAAMEGAVIAADPLEDQISVIGADILVTGNIEAEVDLHIEGRVLGDVRCSTLILGARSSVTGSIYAQRVRVSGRVEGAIETVDLAIEDGAYVKGDVSYSRLRIANGGIVAGQMTHVLLADDAGEGDAPDRVDDSAGQQPGTAQKVHYIE